MFCLRLISPSFFWIINTITIYISTFPFRRLPTCLCSGQKSLILVHSSMSRSFEITPRDRSSQNTSTRGTMIPIRSPRNCLPASLTFAKHYHRQALRYIIRNLSLPARTRAQAQLQLSQMHCYTRSTQIRNRCIIGGKGRGVLGDFKMSRVRPGPSLTWCAHC